MSHFISHQTKNENILWYIDSIDNIVSDSYKVKGWITHKSLQITDIFLGENKISFKPVNRFDVKNVYPFISSSMVGVEFIINKSDIYLPINLKLSDDTRIEDIGNLHSWFIHKLGFNRKNKDLVVVENFYNEPDMIRDFAINHLSYQPSGYHKGQRSTQRFILDGTKEIFEEILGRRIYNWFEPAYANGVFQFCTKEDPIVYHVDTQMYAAIVFLSPDAPLNSGTATYKSKLTRATRFENNEMDSESFRTTFSGGGNELNFYDNSTFEIVDKVSNVYNRLVMWDAKTIHAATEYYGTDINNSRFFHLFFFDVE